MNIYKLLAGIVFTLVMVVAAPYAAVKIGALAPLTDKAWLILLVTACGLIVKSIIGDVVAGEFLFHKFGYDNCVMTLGAVLTALALQLMATADLFPGMNNVDILRALPALSGNPIANRSIQLFVLLLIALVCTLFTGRISAAIKHENARGKDFLALVNSVTGVGVLALYVLVLITKG